MANTVFNGVIRLRKDTEQAFAVIENSFIPADGEVCLVETAQGIRVKVGDGVSLFKALEYIDVNLIHQITDVITLGYLLNGKFYTDSTYTILLETDEHKLYIDKNTNIIYHYSLPEGYISVNDTLPNASESTAGIMKLYNVKGQQTNGTMTQKAITDNLNTKFEVSVNDEEELVIFNISI